MFQPKKKTQRVLWGIKPTERITQNMSGGYVAGTKMASLLSFSLTFFFLREERKRLAPGGNRTRGLCLTKASLYLLSHRGNKCKTYGFPLARKPFGFRRAKSFALSRINPLSLCAILDGTAFSFSPALFFSKEKGCDSPSSFFFFS